MLLYHFTSFYNLHNVGPDNILAVGLRAGLNSMRDWPADYFTKPPKNAVWLTSEGEPKILFVEGLSECRITVKIPSSDNRLIKWERYLSRHSKPGFMEAARRAETESGSDALLNWFVYFGDIRLHRLRAIEYADPEKRRTAPPPVTITEFAAP